MQNLFYFTTTFLPALFHGLCSADHMVKQPK